jgi:predicted dehydrogenase
VRFGILGCASIAQKVARAMLLVPGAAVAAVGSRSEEKARLFAADNGLPAAGLRLHGSYESLLDDPEVDAVYVPLPTSLHVCWATAAAARGKHVLLEKPTALCAADLDAILAACDAAGLQFMDSTMWMHNPRTAKMRDSLDDKDAIGDIKVVRSLKPPRLLQSANPVQKRNVFLAETQR